MNMREQMREQARLMILTGIALALLILLYVLDPSGKFKDDPNSKAAIDQSHSAAAEEPADPPFEYPAGGREILPAYRLIALYGNFDGKALGSLGEQTPELAVKRVKELAAQYQKFSTEPVYPAFEIITTVASAGPTEDGNYSREIPVDKLKPVIELARQQGVYVLLDLQPGLTDFLTQAKIYEELLSEPHVGLALDPEWRLKPGQKHLRQIGSVNAAEVNQTAAWLADLVKSNKLPQKIMLLHQFKLSMIDGRETLDTSRSELAWCIQMDGLGNQHVKQETWRVIRQNAPAGMHFGWKNFIDEDQPMLTPEQTMSIDPKPFFVSYQ